MLRKWISRLATPLGAGASVLMITAMMVGVYIVYAHANVGPLSAVHTTGTMLGGYNSHADFQQECTHCHGPIHCIIDNRCQSCHVDVAEQRAQAIGLHGLLPVTSECQSCHTEHQGPDAQITTFAFNNVDHALLSGFSLAEHKTDYFGQPLTCESCHQLGQYGPENLDCATCHINHAPETMAEHQAQYGPDCLVCHQGQGSLANFDHNQHFVLAGAHTETACEACHRDHLYAGTPQACEACHPEPDLHAGQFGLACDRCHTDAAWLPAQLLEHNFPLDHGSDSQQACETCHVTSYAEYPCEICHELGDMQMAHTSLNAVELADCLACHPFGLVESTAVASSQ